MIGMWIGMEFKERITGLGEKSEFQNTTIEVPELN